MDVEDLRQLPEEADDDGCGKHRSGGNFAIGQNPVDQEEKQDAGEAGAEAEEGEGDEVEDDVVGVADEDPGEDGLLAGGGGDRRHGQDAYGEREAKRDDLIVQVAAVLADSPDAVEGDFERKEDSR